MLSSGGLGEVCVPLLCCLGGCAEQRSDARPRQTVGACGFNGLDDLALGAGASHCGAAKQVFGNRCLVGVVGFETLKLFCDRA
jgi:hypothetical protein